MDYQIKQLENTISDLKEELAMFKERCLQQERLIHELQKRPFVIPTQPYGPMTPIPCEAPKGCYVCGIGKEGGAMGYVCVRTDCPTGVRC